MKIIFVFVTNDFSKSNTDRNFLSVISLFVNGNVMFQKFIKKHGNKNRLLLCKVETVNGIK